MDLVGDIGGTHVRLGLVHADHGLLDIRQTLAAEHAGVEDAIQDYLASAGHPQIVQAALGVAAPVSGDQVRLPNGPRWFFSQTALHSRFGFHSLKVVNDFEAAAWSLPVLEHSDLRLLGSPPVRPGATKLILGPGTAFGLATAVPARGSWLVLPGEAGELLRPHGDVGKVFSYIADRFHTSRIGGVLSGTGLWRLFEAVRVLEFGQGPSDVTLPPHEIVTLAKVKHNTAALRAVELFITTLGAAAANLALSIMATGGVYLTGGVIKGIAAAGLLDETVFRAAFERQALPGMDAVRGILQTIGTALVTHDYPALRGLQYAITR